MTGTLPSADPLHHRLQQGRLHPGASSAATGIEACTPVLLSLFTHVRFEININRLQRLYYFVARGRIVIDSICYCMPAPANSRTVCAACSEVQASCRAPAPARHSNTTAMAYNHRGELSTADGGTLRCVRRLVTAAFRGQWITAARVSHGQPRRTTGQFSINRAAISIDRRQRRRNLSC